MMVNFLKNLLRPFFYSIINWFYRSQVTVNTFDVVISHLREYCPWHVGIIFSGIIIIGFLFPVIFKLRKEYFFCPIANPGCRIWR